MRKLCYILGTAGFLCSITPELLAQTAQSVRFVPGRLLVRFRDSVPADQARKVIQALQARSTEQIPGIQVHVVELPPNASETAYQNILRTRPDVEFAEVDAVRAHEQSQITPNDPLYVNEWHLSRIQAPNAWSVTTGSPGVIIAIADTGVDSSHPDLMTKMVSGWNVNDNSSDTRDVYGHGTNVAGTTAAATNNGLGVASIAWNCWIMPVRVSLADGSAYDSKIASGIIWAADHGARVVNVSYKVTGSSAVSSAAKYLYNKGGVVTVSAGNYSTFESIPNDPYIITVGATDPSDVLYSFSNTGTAIDLVAPGCVTTTANGGGYTGACGTSFSAPIVAGVAALVISANSNLSASQVTSILQNAADDLGATGWDPTFGYGRVNAARAVVASNSSSPTDTQVPTVSFSSPAAGAVLAGTTSVQVAASDNVGVTSVTVTVNGTVIGSSGAFSWNTTAWPNGSYTLIATARDAAGNSASTSRAILVSNIINTPADTIAPTVIITSPQGGAVLTAQTTLVVTASDNVAVAKVEYYCDGVSVGSTGAAPYSLRWNTKKVKSGAHSLQAKAFDAAGNVGLSGVISVNVR